MFVNDKTPAGEVDGKFGRGPLAHMHTFGRAQAAFAAQNIAVGRGENDPRVGRGCRSNSVQQFVRVYEMLNDISADDEVKRALHRKWVMFTIAGDELAEVKVLPAVFHNSLIIQPHDIVAQGRNEGLKFERG